MHSYSATFMRNNNKRHVEQIGWHTSINNALVRAEEMAVKQSKVDHCVWRVITVKKILPKD